MEDTENLTRTNFEQLQRMSDRFKYIARSCKEILDNHSEQEGRNAWPVEVYCCSSLNIFEFI